MAWKQLKQPNLSTKGTIGFCLKYARNVFNIPAKYPTAWKAWQNGKQHKTKDYPKNVSIPLWFDWKTDGHVVIAVPNKGLYSSPMNSSESKHIFKSISEVESFLGAKYVGWTEDINDVKVVEKVESDMYKNHTAKYWYERAQELRKQRNTLSTKLSNIKDTLFNGIKKVFGR